MSIVDEAEFSLYELPISSRGDRNLTMRIRTCTSCSLEHSENSPNCPFLFIQEQLGSLSMRNNSGDSVPITHLLNHVHSIIQARINYEEDWPLPQALPLHHYDNFPATYIREDIDHYNVSFADEQPCIYCHETGHVARECPHPLRNTG